ncbi:mechanosensitive ion channel [Candidatus Woesearchaeota archaeon]|nr:mechanosensitive ion channel [Candidatus Woesearchaeota archaeon]
MALAALDWLEQFMEGFTPHLNKIVIFFLIIFMGFLVGKILGRLTRKLLHELKADAFIKRTLGWKLGIERGLSSLVAGLVYLISVILALNAVGLTTVVLEIILGVVILTLAISFLIALKDIIPNVSAGITLKQKLKEGTKLKMDDAEGTVKEVTLLETIIETKKKDTIVIPNALFAKQRIKIRK